MIDYSKKAVNGIIPKEHLFQGPLVGENINKLPIWQSIKNNVNEYYAYNRLKNYFTLFHIGKITKNELIQYIYLFQRDNKMLVSDLRPMENNYHGRNISEFIYYYKKTYQYKKNIGML